MPSFPKRQRVRLDPKQYDQLRQEILRRDNWSCQSRGSRHNLQIHHSKKRSHAGDDSDSNLITLCDACHGVEHGEN
jgi:5-methylcytosine-specific restriction endonuclease McrA